ncbi:MAG: amidohydrolase family protein [Dehalococcoidia bacterium]
MSEPEVIDVHIHFTRSRAQEKIVFHKPGWPDEWYNCNPEGLDEYLDSEGLSHLFAINYIDINTIIDNRLARMAADDPQRPAAEEELRGQMTERVRQFNDWIVEYCKTEPRVTPFVNVDIGVFYGDQQAMMDELETRIEQGAKGVKIHPGLSRFYPADEKMTPLYERLQSAGIPILSDSGAAGARGGRPVYGEPVNFAPVFEQFPRLRFIMAHLSTAFWDERVDIAKRFPQVQFDVSGGFYSGTLRARDGQRNVPIEDATRFLRTIGTDRVMFGTDGPGADVRACIRQIMGLDLTDEEKEDILAKNARRFMDM